MGRKGADVVMLPSLVESLIHGTVRFKGNGTSAIAGIKSCLGHSGYIVAGCIGKDKNVANGEGLAGSPVAVI